LRKLKKQPFTSKLKQLSRKIVSRFTVVLNFIVRMSVFMKLWRINKAKKKLIDATNRYLAMKHTIPSGEEERIEDDLDFFRKFFTPVEDDEFDENEYGFFENMHRYGTVPNNIARAVLGLVSVWLFYILIMCVGVLKWSTDPYKVGLICGVLSVITLFGISMNRFVCCSFFVMLPASCTSTARTVLILLVLTWTIQGPMLNMQINLRKTAETLACVQEKVAKETIKLKAAVQNVAESKMKPLLRLTNSFHQLSDSGKNVLKKIHSGVTALGKGVKRLRNWLGNVLGTCNKVLMKPYEICVKMFNVIVEYCDYTAWFMPVVWFVCRVISAVSTVCNVLLFVTQFCKLKDIITKKIKDALLEGIEKKLLQAEERIVNAYSFNFSISETVEYSVEYKTNVTVLVDMLNEKIDYIRELFDMIDISFGGFVGLTLLYMPIAAALYVKAFLHSDEIDNYFITEGLQKFDKRLWLKGQEAILPFTDKERKKYLKRTDLKMTSKELWMRCFPQLLNLIAGFIIIVYWMVVDNSVCTFLKIINQFLNKATDFDLPLRFKPVVVGSGLIAKTYNDIIEEMVPEVSAPENIAAYWQRCITEPTEPDIRLRWITVAIFGYCLITVFVQVYLYRIRSLICETFYPETIEKRIAFMHGEIGVSRGGWKHFAEKSVKAKLGGSKADIAQKLRQRVASQAFLVGSFIRASGGQRKSCIECNEEGPAEDFQNFRNCEACQAAYCIACFFGVTKCMKCNQVKQIDDIEIDEERLELYSKKKQDKRSAARQKRMFHDRQVENTSCSNIMDEER
ncbi:DC-STAMP domain-containing protein 2, partial [Trichinella patagoniensis]